MAIKLGINGFGRIGRMILRSIIESNRKDKDSLLDLNNFISRFIVLKFIIILIKNINSST